MMKKLIAILLTMLVFVPNILAAPPADVMENRLSLVKDYHALKAKADRGHRIRVLVSPKALQEPSVMKDKRRAGFEKAKSHLVKKD